MEIYTGFAQVYDTFMDNVPYEEWGARIISILRKFHIEDGLVLDLGCGTGKMTRYLDRIGYDMIGVDNSWEMLDIAHRNSPLDILYLEQDMQAFELYGTVRAVVCTCDAVNYMPDEASLLQVFRLVNNYLDPGGIFLFDINTVYKYEKVLAENTFAEARDDCAFVWDNFYDPEEGINEYDLSLFVREGGQADGGLYRRFDETHYQKAFAAERIQALLQEAGLGPLRAYDAYTDQPARPDSERIVFLAQEHGKAEKIAAQEEKD